MDNLTSLLVTKDGGGLFEELLKAYLLQLGANNEIVTADTEPVTIKGVLGARSDVRYSFIVQKDEDVRTVRVAIKAIKKHNPKGAVIVIVHHVIAAQIRMLVSAGANAVMSMAAHAEEMERCLKMIEKKRLFLCQHTETALMNELLHADK